MSIVAATMTFLAADALPASAGLARTTSDSPIQHIVVIMQENRSFDNYFGSYPGADGIPNGICVPDPSNGGCVVPSHNPKDRDLKAPHDPKAFVQDVHGGRMDGFVATQEAYCSCSTSDVMGYHDYREVPYYWGYAQNFTLQDHLYSSAASWSLPNHLYLVSGWSAVCASLDALSCAASVHFGAWNNTFGWTDLTYLLHQAGVSWKYYVASGIVADCDGADGDLCTTQQSSKTPSIWNPLPGFATVNQDGEVGNVQPQANLFTDIRAGTLPSVSWVIPNGTVSEHPPNTISQGQQWVASIVDAIMQSPEWASTAIFVTWDEWGGEYDHEPPIKVDGFGYGLRVPGLLISPWARAGYIDHQTLSFDAYAKLIEDLFLGGQRLDPANDGRPDPRLVVRENAPQLGDLMSEFDFAQSPRAPTLVPLMTSSKRSGLPGSSVLIQGSNFSPGEQVSIRFDCGYADCQSRTILATTQADAAGRLRAVAVALPSASIGLHVAGGVGSSGDFGEVDIGIL